MFARTKFVNSKKRQWCGMLTINDHKTSQYLAVIINFSFLYRQVYTQTGVHLYTVLCLCMVITMVCSRI